MRLTVLGCSGSVGGPGAATSGYLLTVADHDPVVIDFGPGVLGELQRHADPSSVSILLSHLHADHCLDLPGLLVWRRYHPVPALGRAPLYGPTGTALRIGAASSEFPGEIDDISDTFDVLPWVEGQAVEIGGLSVIPRAVAHPPETFGLRVTGPDGETLAYSADTGPCDALVELAADADVFLCEASWPHDPAGHPPDLHLSGVEAGQIATKAGVGTLALTHIPPWTDVETVVAEARKEFAGPILAVKSGTVIDIG